MYDPILLQERMAERGFNFYQLAQKAKVDPKTAKSVVTMGTGIPRTVRAIASALGFTLPQIVKRHAINGKRKTA